MIVLNSFHDLSQLSMVGENMLDVTKKEAHIVKASKKLVDWLLSLNTNNRNVKRSHLAWLAQSLKNDEFVLTGQGISVSKEAELIDGQHRLLAIQEAGYPPVELMVVTGLDERARIYVDQHAKRSSADMLKIVLNKHITARMAGVINFHITLKESKKDGFSRSGRKASLDEMVEAMSEHTETLANIITAAGNKCRAGILCGLFHYALKYNEDKALEFAEKIKTGENLKKHDPAYRLREHCIKHNNAGGSASLEDYKITVSACMADALNEDLQALRPSSSWAGLPAKLRRYYVTKDGDKQAA
jgi:hypothetical protein